MTMTITKTKLNVLLDGGLSICKQGVRIFQQQCRRQRGTMISIMQQSDT